MFVRLFERGKNLSKLHRIQPQVVTHIPASPVSQFLFSDTRMAWFWLVVRLYVGYQWFVAGWSKLTGSSIAIGSFGKPIPGGSWVFTTNHGAVLKGFISHSIAQATG